MKINSYLMNFLKFLAIMLLTIILIRYFPDLIRRILSIF